MNKKEVIVIVMALALLGVSMVVSNLDSNFTGFSINLYEVVIIDVVDKSNNPLVGAKIFIDDLNDNKPGRGFAFVSRTKNQGSAEFSLKKGEYIIQVSKGDYLTHTSNINIKSGTNRFTLRLKSGTPNGCIDSTFLETCSIQKPYFCDDNGILEPDCQKCGCSSDQKCQIYGWCS